MSDDKDKLIRRIQKLLALSKSPNQHEAELAMQKANEMMEEHQIHMSQVLFEEASVQEAELSKEGKVSETYRSFVKDIARAAGNIFDCSVLSYEGTQAAFHFVGLREDIALAEVMFKYLFDSWLSIVKQDTKEWKEQFMYEPRQYEVKQFKIGHGQGFATVVRNRAYDIAKARKNKVKASSSSGTDLVVLKDALIKSYMDKYTVSGRRPRGFLSQHSGKEKGRQRGQEIPLSGAIEGSARKVIE